MATQFTDPDLDVKEQVARISRDLAEIHQRQAETKVLGWTTIFQAMIATAGLLGAGAAVTKVFFP